MFEDENNKRQSRQDNDNGYLSARDALTNNSAVKAAVFVAGLMVCVIVIYVFIMGGGIGSSSSPTGTSSAAASGTADPNSTNDTNATNGGTTDSTATPAPTPTEAAFSFKKGDSDPKIQEIQQELKSKKYLDNSVQLDNSMGQKTEDAIKLLQSDLNLDKTGIIDNALYDQLRSVPERFVLKKGSNSDKNKELQILLIDKGYLNMKKEDTVKDFGPKTETAVKLFQKENSLAQTGEVTSVLYQKIEQAPVRNAG